MNEHENPTLDEDLREALVRRADAAFARTEQPDWDDILRRTSRAEQRQAPEAPRRLAASRLARHPHRLRIAMLAAITLVLATGAALASGANLPSFLPGYSSAETPPVPAGQLREALAPDSDSPDTLLEPSSKMLDSLAAFGVDLTQLHRATSTRLGVSVAIAPSTRPGGGICVLYLQQGTTVTQCGSEADVESGGRISAPDGSPIYVGLRPDGITNVTATDGTIVPVIDNVYISDKPILGSPHG